jgi:SAM-dependent methyltransferase
MRIDTLDPPREFTVGSDGAIRLRHVANIELGPDEQVTFVTESRTEYDVVRKDWGYYATPSLNARLRDHGLRGALVRGEVSARLHLLLVERGHEEAFLEYLRNDHMKVAAWLDTDEAVARLLASASTSGFVTISGSPRTCEFCGSSHYVRIKSYDAPPVGETRFAALSTGYSRTLWQCGGCNHVVNQTPVDPDTLYSTDYVDATYGNRLAEAYGRIMSLPPERSDNYHRVERVIDFFKRNRGRSSGTLLDIGSGLGVFGAAMRARGWNVTALDPDERAVRHAREVVGVNGIHGDFMSARTTERFDLVTMNKVLEHVRDPVAFLARAQDWLAPDGLGYVEVPDGEAALRDSPEREEFFVEHRCAFSAISTVQLIWQSGYLLLRLDRIREPSSKYTLAAFIETAGASQPPA